MTSESIIAQSSLVIPALSVTSCHIASLLRNLQYDSVKDLTQSCPQATHYKGDVIKGLSKQGEAEDLTDKSWPSPY